MAVIVARDGVACGSPARDVAHPGNRRFGSAPLGRCRRRVRPSSGLEEDGAAGTCSHSSESLSGWGSDGTEDAILMWPRTS
jgi:hypothetical protein